MAPLSLSAATRKASPSVLEREPVGDHGLRDRGVGRQHRRHLLEFAYPVVGAVAERRQQPGLAVEEGQPVDLDRPVVHPDHHDGAARGHQLAAAGQTLDGPCRLEYHVVEALGADAPAEPLGRLPLVRVPRLLPPRLRHPDTSRRPGRAGPGRRRRRWRRASQGRCRPGAGRARRPTRARRWTRPAAPGHRAERPGGPPGRGTARPSRRRRRSRAPRCPCVGQRL